MLGIARERVLDSIPAPALTHLQPGSEVDSDHTEEPMLRMGSLCVALLLPAVLLGQDGREADEQAIHGVMDGFMDAWNHHDAKAFAALFSEDADFTNVRGMGASGRSSIEQFHAPMFATIFKNSHQKYTRGQDSLHPSGCGGSGCALGDDGGNRSRRESSSFAPGAVELRHDEEPGKVADRSDAQHGRGRFANSSKVSSARSIGRVSHDGKGRPSSRPSP